MVKDGFIERDLKPEERADARKALAYTLGATATIAGTMGLPFASVFFALANAGDDDKDARARYREWLAGHLGKDLAELAAKGVLPRGVLGIDMSGQVGHQDLLPGSRWMSDRRNFEDKVKDQSRTLLGPALNAGFDIYGGMSKAAGGDVVAGIRTMLPRALKGPMEAAITANEGAFVNKAGNTLPVPATSWDYLKLAAGFQPQKKAEQSEANFYYQSEMTQRKQDKAKAKKDAMRMMKDGDYDGAAEHMAEFNAANPGNALAGIPQAMMSQARAQAYASMSGTGILEGNKRHFPMMGAYGTWANTGIAAEE